MTVLRHAVLALVAERPRSGYDLARIFEQTLSYAWTAGHSQIYPELARLKHDRLIREVETGPRGRLLYEATSEGRAVVREWLVETEPARTNRNETILRVFFLWLLSTDDRRRYLEQRRAEHRLALAEYEALAREDAWSSPAGQSGRMALEFGLRYERAMLDWLDWALERLGGTGEPPRV
jgi:PadR family transcriptional regulator, regulatory protein AphA